MFKRKYRTVKHQTHYWPTIRYRIAQEPIPFWWETVFKWIDRKIDIFLHNVKIHL